MSTQTRYNCSIVVKKCSTNVLGPKLLLVMGCVKLGEKNCVQLPSAGEKNANYLRNFTQPIVSNNFGPSIYRKGAKECCCLFEFPAFLLSQARN